MVAYVALLDNNMSGTPGWPVQQEHGSKKAMSGTMIR